MAAWEAAITVNYWSLALIAKQCTHARIMRGTPRAGTTVFMSKTISPPAPQARKDMPKQQLKQPIGEFRAGVLEALLICRSKFAYSTAESRTKLDCAN